MKKLSFLSIILILFFSAFTTFAQADGYFIEDKNGNMRLCVATLDKKFENIFYSYGSNQNYSNNNKFSYSSTPEETINSYKDSFYRDLAQEVGDVLQDLEALREWSLVSHSIFDVPPHIEKDNCFDREKDKRGKNKFIQQFSIYEYKDNRRFLRSDYEYLVKKFCNDVVAKHTKRTELAIDWSSLRASIQTLERVEDAFEHHKKLRKKALNRLRHDYGSNYLEFFIDVYKSELLERERIEKFQKNRIKEKEENKSLAKKKREQAQAVTKQLTDLSNDITKKLVPADKIDKTQNKNLYKNLSKDKTVLLEKKDRETFESVRYYLDKLDSLEFSKTYKKMIAKAEIESFKNNGRINKKLFNRINALIDGIDSGYKNTQSNYKLIEQTRTSAPEQMKSFDKLQNFSGNAIQHNVHGEVVDLVNQYSYYLNENHDGMLDSGINLYEAADVALELNKKLDSSVATAKTKIHERTYSFLDFCHSALNSKVARTALYLWKRAGMGFEDCNADIQNVFSNGLKTILPDISPDEDFLQDILDKKEDLSTILDKHKKVFAGKTKELGEYLSNFFHKLKTQPLHESVGDAVQFLSRKIAQTSAIAVATLGVIITVEAGATIVAPIAGAAAARKALEPFIAKLSSDGTAILEKTASSGVSIAKAISTSFVQVAERFYALSDAATKFCFAADGGGSGGGKTVFDKASKSNKTTNYKIIVTKKEISIIEKHLDSIDALDDCLNKIALKRLKNGNITIDDMYFVEHEILEAKLVSEGMTQSIAHKKALELLEHSPWQIYNKEVVAEADKLMGAKTMNPAYYKFWGLE